MLKRSLIFFIFFCILANQFAFAQPSVKDSILPTTMLTPMFGVSVPLGDMKSRYPLAFQIGGSVMQKFKKNWLVNISGSFLFSEKVNDPNLMQHILPILSQDGTQPMINTAMRGFLFSANAGKIIPLGNKPNKNSGILITVGGGFMQHKIFINTSEGLSPQISGDYKKGYDMLSNGWMANQFIGYVFLGNKRVVNFIIGVEFTQAFVKNRRGYNYSTFEVDNQLKIDHLITPKIGWIFPIYPKNVGTKKVREYIYY